MSVCPNANVQNKNKLLGTETKLRRRLMGHITINVLLARECAFAKLEPPPRAFDSLLLAFDFLP